MSKSQLQRRSFLRSASALGALASASLSASNAAIAVGSSANPQSANDPAGAKHPNPWLILGLMPPPAIASVRHLGWVIATKVN